MKQSVIIFAPNVGTGGGLVLLRELLKSDWGDLAMTAFLDNRARASLEHDADRFNIRWVDPTAGSRLRSEWLLSRDTKSDDIVLCFHNLPPVFPNRGYVICYVQNANLVGLISKAELRGWLRLRYKIERLIARFFQRRVHRYYVQTPTMAESLARWFGPGAPPIEVAPFAGPMPVAKSDASVKQWDFIYVSDGSFHKNHMRLFAAWRLLAVDRLYPSLVVTLDSVGDASLCAEFQQIAAMYGARIENLGKLAHDQVFDAYAHSGALIFPSYMESFGIPLLEAQAASLPILAPELDYVRDVCSPVETFNPSSPRSIARAVQRFLGSQPVPIKMGTGQDFVDRLCALKARARRLA